jgi:hypothetical protein
MQADDRVVLVSLASVPAIALYERVPGAKQTVIYVLVRTEYEESDEDAIKRAHRIADYLTDDLAKKKSGKVEEKKNGQ